MKAKKNDVPFLLFMILPSLFLYVTFSLIPNITPIVYSFFRWNVIDISQSTFAGLNNYSRIFTSDWPHILKIMGNCGYFALTGITISMFISLFISGLVTADHRRPMREIGFYRAVIYIPNLISVAAVSVLWSFMYSPVFGIINPLAKAIGLDKLAETPILGTPATARPAIVVMGLWGSIGFTFILFYSAIKSIPTTYFEAAEIDGAGPFRQYWHVTLPLISKTIKTLLIVSLAGIFSGGFIQIQILTKGGPNFATETLTLFMYRKAFTQGDFGYGSAIGTIVLLMSIGIYLVTNKLFSKGDDYEY
jgi:N-acetylglucosamine transport system permease protein